MADLIVEYCPECGAPFYLTGDASCDCGSPAAEINVSGQERRCAELGRACARLEDENVKLRDFKNAVIGARVHGSVCYGCRFRDDNITALEAKLARVEALEQKWREETTWSCLCLGQLAAALRGEDGEQD